MAFGGFGPGARAFFAELSANNDRDWFEAERPRYEREVLRPAEAFVMELGPALARLYPSVSYGLGANGRGSVMRLHRDLRFSKDKRPYKENLGVIFPLAPGKKVEAPIFYFHLDAERAFFYGGRHVMPPDILGRYRAAVEDERRGPRLVQALEALGELGLAQMEEPAYKRAPAGYDPRHPRSALLRQAALGVGVELCEGELGVPGLVARCLSLAGSMRPLLDWLMDL